MSEVSWYPAAGREPLFDLHFRYAIGVLYDTAKKLRRQATFRKHFKQTSHAVRANADTVGCEGGKAPGVAHAPGRRSVYSTFKQLLIRY